MLIENIILKKNMIRSPKCFLIPLFKSIHSKKESFLKIKCENNPWNK